MEFQRRQVEQHQQRLLTVFHILDEHPNGEEAPVAKALVDHLRHVMERCRRGNVADAALILGMQQINHHEIAIYGSSVSFAKTLELHSIATHLLDTLRDEKDIDRRLSDLAEATVNPDSL